MSPDGSHLALRVAAKDSLARLVVLDLKTLVPKDVASFREGDVGYFDWVNDSRLVFKLSPRLQGVLLSMSRWRWSGVNKVPRLASR